MAGKGMGSGLSDEAFAEPARRYFRIELARQADAVGRDEIAPNISVIPVTLTTASTLTSQPSDRAEVQLLTEIIEQIKNNHGLRLQGEISSLCWGGL
jgi:hypothetical protein